MGFLIAKHILYSGKTMDQTNEILFIQEKRKEIVNPGFQRYTKRNEMRSGRRSDPAWCGKRSAAHVKNNEVDQ